MITCNLLKEAGYYEALQGISLNKQQPMENMIRVSEVLATSTKGSHRKFLRQIQLWFYLRLPRYLWVEFDTYKVGVTRNSGSTMHNIHKRPFELTDFMYPLNLGDLNQAWYYFKDGKLSIEHLKALIPEGLLQDSIVTLNYEVLRTMYYDRKTHRLESWRQLLDLMLSQIEHPELVTYSIQKEVAYGAPKETKP